MPTTLEMAAEIRKQVSCLRSCGHSPMTCYLPKDWFDAFIDATNALVSILATRKSVAFMYWGVELKPHDGHEISVKAGQHVR